jgi:3-hydroxyisobutyrate dehydrogenase-like beta-hydroxyacid dehydrogenase
MPAAAPRFMSRRTRKNVGVIGLGIIGSRVRDVLRRKGFHVFVWNRTPRPIPNFVGAPAELAEMCDFVQIFVSDDDALLFVAKQLSPGLAARHVVIAHSTVSPATMCAAAEIVERRGARFVEAPFTGSKEAAENGELVYYVSGEEAAVREARSVLEASSKDILEIGEEIGQATAIKVATNMVTAASVQSAAEALALVHAAGLPLDKFALAMQQNASNSKTLSMKLPKMIQGNFERHFSVQHMLKDMQIASRLGLSHHLELAVSAAARDRLLEQMQRGHGDDDYSAVALKYFHEAQPDNRAETDLDLFKVAAPETPASPTVAANVTEDELPPAPPAIGQEPEHNLETILPEPAVFKSLEETESKVEHSEHENGEHASMQAASTVLPHPVSLQLEEEESQQPGGFFSRLLRRASN